MSDKYIHTIKLFDAQTVAASQSATTSAIDLNKYKPEGFLSLQVKLTGSGTAQFTFLLSNDGVDYLTPTGSSDIVTAHTVSSGPSSDGKDIYLLEIIAVTRYLKIKVLETAAAEIVVTATLVIQ